MQAQRLLDRYAEDPERFLDVFTEQDPGGRTIQLPDGTLVERAFTDAW